MSVQHFKSLLFKSSQIQEQIEKEQRRPRPDWMRLLKLKKIRLSIKDKLYKIAEKRKSSAVGVSAQYLNMQPVVVQSGGNVKRLNKYKGG